MSFPEYENLLPEEAEINAEVKDGTVFFVYCFDCEKVLYCALEDTFITRRRAASTVNDHSEFFEPNHNVRKILK